MIERRIRYSVGSAAAVFVLALFAADAVPKPGPHQVAADRAFAVPADAAAAITKASETWIDAFERGDAETMAGFFTEDGLYAANTGQVLRGRDGIREGVRGWVDRRTKFLAAVGLPVDSGIDVEEQALRFRTAGEAVYRLSRFMIRVEPSRCAMDAGHIISIWRKQPDGSWRIESVLGNRDVEPPKEACGQRKAPEL